MFYIAGPGHGGPALVSHTYLEGAYSEIYPDISQDEAGLRKLFTQFSFPGGSPVTSRRRLRNRPEPPLADAKPTCTGLAAAATPTRSVATSSGSPTP
jgi:hypothetical protein